MEVGDFDAAFQLAHQYCMDGIQERIKNVLLNSALLSQEPLAVFAIATSNKWQAIVIRAARFTLQHPLKFTEEPIEELHRVTGTDYHNLLSYHRLCGDAAKKVLTLRFHRPITRHMSNPSLGAAAPSVRSSLAAQAPTPPLFPFGVPPSTGFFFAQPSSSSQQCAPKFGNLYWMASLPALWMIARSVAERPDQDAPCSTCSFVDVGLPGDQVVHAWVVSYIKDLSSKVSGAPLSGAVRDNILLDNLIKSASGCSRCSVTLYSDVQKASSYF